MKDSLQTKLSICPHQNFKQLAVKMFDCNVKEKEREPKAWANGQGSSQKLGKLTATKQAQT